MSEVATAISLEEEVNEIEEVDEAENVLEQGESGSDSLSDGQDEFPDTSITVAHVTGET